MAEIRSLIAIVILLIVSGCSTQKAVVDDGTSEFLTSLEFQASLASTKQEIASKNDQILHAVGEQSRAITTLTKTLEASLVKSEPKPGSEVIKSALESPPAKNAKDSHPTKGIVAEPVGTRLASDGTVLKWNVEGNWNPTILETSAHLGQDHGINTDGMTHQEMADLHAAIHEGKAAGGAPLTGAIFPHNGTSAVTSQRVSVRSVPQRFSFVGRTKYQTRQSCPSGRCPQR